MLKGSRHERCGEPFYTESQQGTTLLNRFHGWARAESVVVRPAAPRMGITKSGKNQYGITDFRCRCPPLGGGIQRRGVRAKAGPASSGGVCRRHYLWAPAERPHVSGGGTGEVSFRKRHLPRKKDAPCRARQVISYWDMVFLYPFAPTGNPR